MYVTNKPATAIIIVLAAFLIATLALACSSATRRAGDVNTDRAALAALLQRHQWKQLAGQH